MQSKAKMWRHGDLQVIAVVSLPADAVLLKGKKVLADGEVTGHAHRVDVGELFQTKDGKLFLKVGAIGSAKLTHEEHKVITLKPGVYRVATKRQYSPDGWEPVRD